MEKKLPGIPLAVNIHGRTAGIALLSLQYDAVYASGARRR
jgi:hypothetical protein